MLVIFLLVMAEVFAGIDWGVSLLTFGIYGVLLVIVLILWKKLFKSTW